MMLQIGVGYAPRTLRALQTQPAQGLMVMVASDDAAVPVHATAMTIEVASPSVHAGRYPLAMADLARGPVCLAPPVIRQVAGMLEAQPGLWAYDASRGPATIVRHWLAGNAVLAGATGLTFQPADQQAGKDIVHGETARQGEVQTGSLSLPFRIPALSEPDPVPQPQPEPDPVPQPEPEPEPETDPKPLPDALHLAVTSDATLEVVLGGSSLAEIEIVEPQDYAGRYSLSPALLEGGPVWLVPALIEGSAQVGATLTLKRPGLPIGDAEAGPVTRQGQWHRDGKPIAGAIGDSYLVVATDAGRRIGFGETASDKRGSRQQMSNELAIGAQSSGDTA